MSTVEYTNMGENDSDVPSNSTVEYSVFLHSSQVTVLLSIMYIVVFILAIIGNCMVIGVVYKNTCMHTVTNFLLVNLAVADILVSIFCLPVTLVINILSSYPFGPVLCKISPFLQGVVVSASVNTLAVIALDRYLAICWTLRFRITKRACKIIILVIWIGSAGIISPWLLHYKLVTYIEPEGVYYSCFEHHWQFRKEYYLGVILLLCYAVPLLLISACYCRIGVKICHRQAPGVQDSSEVVHRSKIRVLKMLITVVSLFALCWLPLYVISGFVVVGEYNEPDGVLYQLLPYVQWLGLSSCCVNPLVYGCFSKKYRNGFRYTVTCTKNYSLENVSVATRHTFTVRKERLNDATPDHNFKKHLILRTQRLLGNRDSEVVHNNNSSGSSVTRSKESLMYLAICQPLPGHRISRKTSKILIAIIWVVSFLIMIPWLIFFNLHSTPLNNSQIHYSCYEEWPTPHQKRNYFLGVTLLVCYAIPAVLITGCYTLIGLRVCRRAAPGVREGLGVIEKSKINVLKMSFTVEFLFIFMWLPLYVMTTLYYYESHNDSLWMFGVFPYVQWLGLSSCCVNPLVYGMFSKKYRQAFRRVFGYLCREKKQLKTIRGDCATFRTNICTDLTLCDQKLALRLNDSVNSLNSSSRVSDRVYHGGRGSSEHSPLSDKQWIRLTEMRKNGLGHSKPRDTTEVRI